MNRYCFVIFMITMFLAGCFRENDYNNPTPGKVINFTSGNQTLLADGKSSATISVKISEDAAPERRKVVFRTSLGSFVNGTGDSIVVTAGQNFEASVNLISMATGTATISATIQSVKSEEGPTITFTKAFPDKIAVAVDSFVIYNNYSSEVLITSSLSRLNGGKPSRNHSVNFQVTDLAGNSIGSFLNGINTTSTNNDGKAFIRYSAGPVSYTGFLNIIASTQKEDGSDLSTSTQIFLSH